MNQNKIIAVFSQNFASSIDTNQHYYCPKLNISQIYEKYGFERVAHFDPRVKFSEIAILEDYNINFYNALKELPNIKMKILILWESVAVIEKQYQDDVLSKFDLVFTWNDALVNKRNIFKIFPMQYGKKLKDAEPWEVKKDLVLLNANKYSFYKTELYTERRKAISYFTKSKLQFDLFGYDWQKGSILKPRKTLGYFGRSFMSRIKQRKLKRILGDLFQFFLINKKQEAYKGIVENKIETLSKYKYCICFENDIAMGNITEKIFDCFFAGTIPIYLGASNIQDYIPTEAYIDMRNFESYNELEIYLLNLEQSTIKEKLKCAEEFINSDEFNSRWRPEAVNEKIAHIISEAYNT